MDGANFNSFDDVLVSLPPEATISRTLLERTIAAQRPSGGYDYGDLFPALISAVVSLELQMKELEVRG